MGQYFYLFLYSKVTSCYRINLSTMLLYSRGWPPIAGKSWLPVTALKRLPPVKGWMCLHVTTYTRNVALLQYYRTEVYTCYCTLMVAPAFPDRGLYLLLFSKSCPCVPGQRLIPVMFSKGCPCVPGQRFIPVTVL
jgi:hypothetical protein